MLILRSVLGGYVIMTLILPKYIRCVRWILVIMTLILSQYIRCIRYICNDDSDFIQYVRNNDADIILYIRYVRWIRNDDADIIQYIRWAAITLTLSLVCMMTSSNGNIFRVTGAVTGEFPLQRPVTRSFDAFFDLCVNKRLSKQSCGWWFETSL